MCQSLCVIFRSEKEQTFQNVDTSGNLLLVQKLNGYELEKRRFENVWFPINFQPKDIVGELFRIFHILKLLVLSSKKKRKLSKLSLSAYQNNYQVILEKYENKANSQKLTDFSAPLFEIISKFSSETMDMNNIRAIFQLLKINYFQKASKEANYGHKHMFHLLSFPTIK